MILRFEKIRDGMLQVLCDLHVLAFTCRKQKSICISEYTELEVPGQKFSVHSVLRTTILIVEGLGEGAYCTDFLKNSCFQSTYCTS